MAAELFYLPFPVAFTANGLPAAGAELNFYLTGTLTRTDVYTTSGLVTAHANPVVANGAGRFPTIYTSDAVNYRLIIKDAAGNTLDDIDPYIPGAAGSPGTPGANAATPVWTIATGAAGTNVVVTGTYPTQTITIPRGTPGSGVLGDADYGDITVTGVGTVMTIDPSAVTLAKMANMATASFIARNTAAVGVPEVVPAATARTMLSINNTDNTSDVNKPVSTAQQTALDLKSNIIPREQAVASSATVTPTFLNDQVNITAQAAALNLANPTGTAVPNHGIVIRIKDDGVLARAITYGAQYRALGTTLPTTTVLGKTMYLGMIFNSASTTWDVVSVAQQA